MPQSKTKRQIILILSVAMVAASCNSANKRLQSELPADALDRETMTALITDIHLVEAALVKKQNQGLLAFDLAEIYYDSLFAKYAISRVRFDSSISYYSRKPELLEETYVAVITNLSKKESEPGISTIATPEVLTDTGEEAVKQDEQITEEESEPIWWKKKVNPWQNFL